MSSENHLSFDQLVEVAREILKGGEDALPDFHLPGNKTVELFAGRGRYCLLRNPAAIVAAAETDPVAFSELEHGIAAMRALGETVPPAAAALLSEVLQGRRERPPQLSKSYAAPMRETAIGACVMRLISNYRHADGREIIPTRNVWKAGDHDSACDAVARAMSLLGWEKAECPVVMRIWTKFEKKLAASRRAIRAAPKTHGTVAIDPATGAAFRYDASINAWSQLGARYWAEE